MKKEYNENDFLNLSGIQHFAFCSRQWALIHIEQQWADNLRTVEGEILHENAHNDRFVEKRGDILITRGLPVFSRTLGINGVCDIVEFEKSDFGVSIFGRDGLYVPIPVEYKRGRPKENMEDEIQLCCQAMCLEDMLLCNIYKGYLYYGETKHRHEVVFSKELRKQVESITSQMHDYYERGYTPKVKISKKCRACSLCEICIPRLCKSISAKEYIKSHIQGDGE
ncbi:MAG: CRISPR-associated protein Cas4 [Clostridia bacterium]|nr:CRISPR-associated protein Cas4 [Clostridia bacterium]